MNSLTFPLSSSDFGGKVKRKNLYTHLSRFKPIQRSSKGSRPINPIELTLTLPIQDDSEERERELQRVSLVILIKPLIECP